MTELALAQRSVITPGGHGLGHRPDTRDVRDLIWQPTVATPFELPAAVRLDETPAGEFAPYDQGPLGSCTANGLSGAVEFDLRAQHLTDFRPARLAVYWWERYIEGTTGTDSGAAIRDGVKVLNTIGAPPETLWPYDVAKFKVKPTKTVVIAAGKTLVTKYERVLVNVTTFQQVLASGKPIVFGITVYPSFEQNVGSNGVVPMPSRGEQPLGGHCMLLVGYAPLGGKLYFRVRNSWGTGWADKGYCWLPAGYVASSQFASDCWSLTAVV